MFSRSYDSLFMFSVLFGATIGFPLSAQTQENNPDRINYAVSKTAHSVKIDGILDDSAWLDATAMKLYYEYFPGDNIPAPVETDFLITFDEKHLYMAFRCVDPDPSGVRAHLMDRDAVGTLTQDDHVGVMIDFFNDERRAFEFRVNPLGVQADAIFSEMDGNEDFSWDAIWESQGKMTDFGWVVEISIPFNQLRFPSPENVQTWGISAFRSYPRNVLHLMASHKNDRDISSLLNQFTKVTGFQGMKTGWNLELDPTLTAHRTDERTDFPSGGMETGAITADPGMSMRWGITPNMVLNMAVNPDFSQVEADVRQLEVNRRYAVRYPEKRPFFLEGADIFTTPIEAVFTRTVADPDFGFKFTGKTGKTVMGIFGTYDRWNNLTISSNAGSVSASVDQNLSGGVFRMRRDVGQGSTMGVLYTGRMGDDYSNHAAGLDGYFRLSKTKILSVQYLFSRTDYPTTIDTTYQQDKNAFNGGALSFLFAHQGRDWATSASYQDLSPGFRADFGYIPRADFRTGQIGISRNFWGKSGGWYNLITVGGYGGATFDYQGDRTDSDVHLYATYSGPLQTNFSVIGAQKREVYAGAGYDLTQAMVTLDMKPAGGFRLYMMTHFGDMVDYSNLRLARHIILNPAVEFGLGKHINIDLRHRYMRLSLHGDEIFTANLFQAKLIYNFNVRSFIRAMVQYQTIVSNPELYAYDVLPKTSALFTQFLFSYKLNPQTVLFLGYSDDSLGYTGIDIKLADRTFFVKIGYAWLQ